MQQPTIGRVVIYTDNAGTRYAAIVSRDPQPSDDGRALLFVFGSVLSGDHLVDATYGEGSGHWSWPERVPSGGGGSDGLNATGGINGIQR